MVYGRIWGRIRILSIFFGGKNIKKELEIARQQVNWARYQPGQATGHYESFFQRANHPTRPLAFWIRYTIFSPQNHPENAVGELWAIYFDGETGNHVALRKEIPFKECVFKTDEFFVKVGDSILEPGGLRGSVASGGIRFLGILVLAVKRNRFFCFHSKVTKEGCPKQKFL